MPPVYDVIIPARDEAATVGEVVRAARAAAGAGTVLVVDDGSTDATAAAARAAGAHVIAARPPGEPGHKGRALAAGVAASTAARLVFFDADLLGAHPRHFEALAAPLAEGRFALSCGLLDYGPLFNPAFLRLPPITGLRALDRELFAGVDLAACRGFQIEILINEVLVRRGLASTIRVLRGLSHRTKLAKLGWRRGLPAHLRMSRDLLACLKTVPLWTYPAYLRRLTLLRPAGAAPSRAAAEEPEWTCERMPDR